jgi:ABC-type multidrug transport system fused ATPase/permease subunit
MFKNLKILIRYIEKKRVYQIIFLQILSFISSFVETLSVGAVVPFIAIISTPEKIIKFLKTQSYFRTFEMYDKNDLILFMTILFVILIFTSAILKWILLLYNTRVANSIGSELAYTLYNKTLYQPYLEHTSRNSSAMITNINRASEIVSQIIIPFFLLINSLFTLCLLLITLIILNPLIILSTFFIIGSFYLLIMFFVKDKLKKESIFINTKKPILMKVMQEGLGGIRDILIDGTQEIFSKIYLTNDKEMRHSIAKVSLISNTPNIVVQSLGISLIATFAALISMKNNFGNEDFSTGVPFLAALAFGFLRISPALQQVYTTWASINNGKIGLDSVVKFLKKPLPYYAGKPLPQPIKFNNCLEFVDISFRYNIELDNVLKNINFKIKKGTIVGIIGKTGSGKSTLLDILMALVEPTSGCFQVDGVKIDSTNFRSLQVRIAHVPQAIFLSDCTIAENIAFGIPFEQIDMKRVINAAEKAQISESINTFQNKYYTKVGERGVRLSGGQRQRIGIARALYKNADILIFDEATSALDNNTEIEVMKSINLLSDDLTIIIVAHRTTTLKNCNQVFEIIDGKIHEKPTIDL